MSEIIFSGVYKQFGTSGKRKVVIDNLELCVEQGDVYGLLGPNGAGKSTAIKLLLDLIRPDKGSITIRGLKANNPASRSCLGYLPENPYFYDHLSGWETLIYCGQASGLDKKEIEVVGAEQLDKLRLSDAADQSVRTYSKGMKQRLGLATAIIHDPDILILDEPMSGLDPVGRHMVASLLEEMRSKGKTIFMCSHILSDIERLCDKVGIMHESELRYDGSIQVLLNEFSDIENAFLKIINYEI